MLATRQTRPKSCAYTISRFQHPATHLPAQTRARIPENAYQLRKSGVNGAFGRSPPPRNGRSGGAALPTTATATPAKPCKPSSARSGSGPPSSGLDELIISLCAGGMTLCHIGFHLERTLGELSQPPTGHSRGFWGLPHRMQAGAATRRRPAPRGRPPTVPYRRRGRALRPAVARFAEHPWSPAAIVPVASALIRAGTPCWRPGSLRCVISHSS